MKFALFSRNIKLYFRHHKTVAMSFFTVFMMLFMYVMFLGAQHVQAIQSTLSEYHVQADETNIRWLVNCWVLGGLLSVVPFTASRAVLGQMIKDYEGRIMRDIKSAPIHMTRYPIALILAAAVIGMIMAMALLLVVGFYIVMTNGHHFHPFVALQIIAVVGIYSFMCASVLSLPVSFMHTLQDYNTFCTVVDMLIGFLNCVYIPIGLMPSGIQDILRISPFNQATELLRTIVCKGPMNAVFTGLSREGMMYYENYEGVATKFAGFYVHPSVILLHMLLWSVVCFVFFTLNFRKKQATI